MAAHDVCLDFIACVRIGTRNSSTFITSLTRYIDLIKVLTPNSKNMNELEMELAKKSILYDLMLYIILPIQYGTLLYFLYSFNQQDLTTFDIIGRVTSMGLFCGVFGINVGHELGHRAKEYEKNIAKSLLLSSLYMHFYIEHNRGHHKHVGTHLITYVLAYLLAYLLTCLLAYLLAYSLAHLLVATYDDPSSARKNEAVYPFVVRSIVYSYLSAWKISNEDCCKKGISIYSCWSNEMLRYQLIQLAFVSMVYLTFGIASCSRV